MALNKYVSKLEFARQGACQGSVTQAGREGFIEVWGFNHRIHAPRDAASGLATGKRKHEPCELVTAIDKSTPAIMQALTTNENASVLEVQFFSPQVANDRSTAKGSEVHNFKYSFSDVQICDAELRALNNRVDANRNLPELVTWKFTYRKVVWTWVPDGIEAEDDWEASHNM